MRHGTGARRGLVSLGLLASAALLGGCAEMPAALSPGSTGAPSAMEPRGPAAAHVAQLWWVLLGTASVVSLIVFALLGYALFRSRRRAGSALGDGRVFITIAGAVLPAVILIGVMVYTVGVQSALANPRGSALTIEVTGHQWWWQVNYLGTDAITANEIHIPVGRPVLLKLRSADVIHSLWVPQLQVKMDLFPGQTNTTWLEADTPGEYRGQCAEFCGQQHAHMAFLVIAEPAAQFDTWLAHEATPSASVADPQLEQGKQIFLGSSCVYCHAIRGTSASGELGPDLTHLASRRTIGAGTLANTRGNLAGWIINSQTVKPDNRMPPIYMDSASLQALLTYMESLK